MKTLISIAIILGSVSVAHGDPSTELIVTSSAFSANGEIPAKYTCEATETTPPLAWTAGPATTRSYAILVEDPDAPKGTVLHWMVTNLPASTTSLAEGATLPKLATTGKNERGDAKYMGPCPPSGRHHYHFHVYALDTLVKPAASRKDFAAATQGHVVAMGDLVATYQKQKP